MILKKILIAIPCIVYLLFCLSCQNNDQPLIKPLSDEDISNNLLSMGDTNGSIDPELLIGEWEIVKFAYTADGKEFSNVAAIADVLLKGFIPYSNSVITILNEDLNKYLTNEYLTDEYLTEPPSLSCCLIFFPKFFLYSISDNLISYYTDFHSMKIGNIYSDDGLNVYKALQNTHSFVIRGSELIIYFTGEKNKNLLFLRKR